MTARKSNNILHLNVVININMNKMCLTFNISWKLNANLQMILAPMIEFPFHSVVYQVCYFPSNRK